MFDDLWDDCREVCPNCGKPMSSDLDGDGVMTMSYEYCVDCGIKDYGEPVRITEELLEHAKRNKLPPYDKD